MSDQIEREQQIEEESLTKNSLQIQKAAWIREELEKRRAQEDQLLQQILREQQMLQELDEDMDQNMAHAKEGRRYREDMKARVDDRVYEMHDLSADKREGMREYGYAYRRGYALAMVFFSLALCVFAGYLHGIASQTCLVLMFFTGVQAAILVHKKQCPKFWQFVCDVFSALIFPGLLILFFVLIVFFMFIYKVLPNRTATFKSQLIGAVGCSAAWYVFSFGLSVYVDYFNGFSLYGSLTTIFLLMFWLYISMYIFLVCAEVNNLFEILLVEIQEARQRKKEREQDKNA